MSNFEGEGVKMFLFGVAVGAVADLLVIAGLAWYFGGNKKHPL